MTKSYPQQVEAATPGLVGEIERYLEAVELFRHERCEPRWRSCGDLVIDGGLCQPPRRRMIDATTGDR